MNRTSDFFKILVCDLVDILNEVLRAYHFYIFQEFKNKPSVSLKALHLRYKVIGFGMRSVLNLG